MELKAVEEYEIPLDVERGVSSDKTSEKNTVEIPAALKPLASQKLLYLTFFLLGMSSLLVWNYTCLVLPYICKMFLNNAQINNTVLGTFQSMTFVAQSLLLLLKQKNHNLVCGFAVLGAVAGLFLIPSAIYLSNTSAFVCIYLLSGVMGVAQGVVQGLGYSIAAMLPSSYVGAVSFGQGAAGLFVFILFLLSSFIFFDLETAMGLRNCLILNYAICASIVFLTAIIFKIAMELDVVNKAFEEAQRIVDELNANYTGKRRPISMILKDCWVEISLAFAHFVIAYHIYPNIGPLHWNSMHPISNYYVIMYGTFFSVETVGRALPDLHNKKYLSWLILPRGAYITCVLSRVLLYIPFILPYIYSDVPVINSLGWFLSCMIILALTQGWWGTLAFHYVCNAVDDPREKLVTGPCATLAVVAGVCVGLFTASFY